MTFHDDAINFITDLFIKLQAESKSQTVGSGESANESANSTLLRLIGVLATPNIKVGDKPAPKTPSATAPTTAGTLYHSFLKVQTRSVELELATINRLLKAYKSRLSRYSRARSKIKLNRIQRLIAEPKTPVTADSLVKDTPEDTRRAVAKQLQTIQESGDLTGILQQQISTHQALTASIDGVAGSLPNNIGTIRSQLISLLRATGKESFDAVEQLTTLQNELTKESDKLLNSDNLLFAGQETFAGSQEKLSLLQVLDLLILLTDRQQVKYQCAECKFFQPGQTPACLFAGSGSAAKTAQVSVTNTSGAQVSGRLTQPTNSCLQVWGLDTNEFFSPSDSIVKSLEDILKGSN